MTEELEDHICPHNLCEECGKAQVTSECTICGAQLCEFCFNMLHGVNCDKQIVAE